jgi:hypothetical protein
MPIEIKELHIRVSVSPPAGGQEPAGAPASAPADGDERGALVAECVEHVMRALRDQRER